MFVLTIDQRSSRRDRDRVEGLLSRVNDDRFAAGRLRRFERTAGDEVQGVVGDSALVVALALDVVREGHWSVGIGSGPVRGPLPISARAGAGPAYELARVAVSRAKNSQDRVAVEGTDPVSARAAEAVLVLLAAVVHRRSGRAWEAVDVLDGSPSQSTAAGRLGISKQAFSQRLRSGMWPHEVNVRPVAAALLTAADRT